MNIYEIYLKNGSLIWINCKDRKTLETMPEFDCIITCNDATQYGRDTAITWEG